MVFCAYCGQKFGRKEHLERHLPSHTNVRPYGCDLCQLSFARRDLLRKHHSTYHEVRDPLRTSGGKWPIGSGMLMACRNCATAKAGCDKEVPCSRCANRNLTCIPRFARPSKGIIARVVTANGSLTLGGAQTSANSVPRSATGDQLNSDTDLSQAQLDIYSHENAYDFLYSGDFDPDGIDLESPNVWGNGPWSKNMCASAGMDFSKDPAGVTLTSPSGLSSLTHRRTDSSGRTGPQLPEQAHPIMGLYGGVLPEISSVVAGDDGWPFMRCNPKVFARSCPKTAMDHLQRLQNNMKTEEGWIPLDYLTRPSSLTNDENTFRIVPLRTTTRDKIIAFAQSFLLRALRTHKNEPNLRGMGSFFIPPPSNVLEKCLQSFVYSLSSYYSLSHGTELDPNELILDNESSNLLFLLMIAQGAHSVPRADGRFLAGGLTEICRISLSDVQEKIVELSADPVALESAFLLIMLCSWGGDAWHIKMAVGSQREMYLAMLRHAGMLEPQDPGPTPFDKTIDSALGWEEWLQREHSNRLVYNWVMFDQELSLFHDTAPILSIDELQTSLPCNESLWQAENLVEWLKLQHEMHADTTSSNIQSPTNLNEGMSLRRLFHNMLHEELDMASRPISPLRLKALLHPLQSLVYHLGQLLSYFYGVHDTHHSSKLVATASMLGVEEVQSSLQRWYDLCMIYTMSNRKCCVIHGSLVLYHLICLNTLTYFPGIERLSRRESFDGSLWQAALYSRRIIYQPEKAIFHCEQVFNNVSAIPQISRPPWWPAAIYRATMIVWAECISRVYSMSETRKGGASSTLNSVGPGETASKPYPPGLYEVPAVLKMDGSFVDLGNPDDVLRHCLSLLAEGTPTRFSEGVSRKIQTMARNWKGVEAN